MIENFIFWGKKSILFDQLFEFYELKYKFNFSQNDGQNSKKSIKKYIQNQSHILDFSKLQDKIKISTNFKMTKNLIFLWKNPHFWSIIWVSRTKMWFIYSKHDGQKSENSIKKYIQNQILSFKNNLIFSSKSFIFPNSKSRR